MKRALMLLVLLMPRLAWAQDPTVNTPTGVIYTSGSSSGVVGSGGPGGLSLPISDSNILFFNQAVPTKQAKFNFGTGAGTKTFTFPGTTQTLAGLTSAQSFVGTQTFSGGTVLAADTYHVLTQSVGASSNSAVGSIGFFADSSLRPTVMTPTGGLSWDTTSLTGIRVLTIPNVSGTNALETGMPVGTGTGVGAVWRIVCSQYASNVTVGLTEEVIATCTLPANTLTTDAVSKLRFTWYGQTANNANTKTIRWHFGGIGGVQCGTLNTTAAITGLRLTGTINRVTSTTQYCTSDYLLNATASSQFASPTATLTGSVDLVITAVTATAAGDVINKALVVEVSNSNN